MTAEEYLNQSLGSSDTGMSADLFLDEQLKEPADTSIGDVLQGTAMDLEDAISVIGRIPQALATGIPAQYQKLVSGTAMPKKSEAIESDIAFQAQINKELEDRKASGELGMLGSATRQMLPSIATSVMSMGAAIPAGAVGSLATPLTGVATAGLASGAVSYRMQGADYLYRAFKQFEENKGSPLTDEEKAEAYKVLLPLAQKSALWEAGPEAIGNAVSLGVGKFVFGFGKEAATQLAKESGKAVEKHLARKIAEKTAAVAGGAGTEVGTEAITALGQYAPEMAAKQYAETGTIEGAPTEYPGGILQAAKDVAPATLATQALFMGAGGAVKLAGLPFEGKPKTPVQITEDNINIQADKEATNLSIDPNDEVSKGLSETIKSIQDNLVSKKEIYSALEATDPSAQTLKLEIKDDENRLVLMQAELNKRAGVELTEVDKKQIELAKAITTPEVVAPTEPAAPTTPAIAAQESAKGMNLQEVSESAIAAFPDMMEAEGGLLPLTRFTPDEQASLRNAGIVETATTSTGETYEGVNAEYLWQRRKQLQDERAKKVQESATPATEVAPPTEPTIKESLPVAPEAPAITPTPVAETPAVTEAPAAEVAPAIEPLTDDRAETIRDVITLRKSQGREPNPEQVKRLAEYDARKAGVEVQEGDIVSNIVVGHPMFEAPQPELSNLVPIKVQNKEQLASPIQRTQQVRDAAQSYIGQYQVEQAKAKTPAQKKAFAKKFNKSELDRQRDILDYIKNDVMPELDRLEKSAPSVTPAVSETITPAAEPAGKPKLGEKGGVLIPSREDFIQAGQNIYEAGMEFGTWAKQMIQQFGDVVREFLGDVWQAVSGMPAKLNEVMGYLPKKGEGGELSFGKTGKLKRYTDKGTIVKLAIKQEKDTPKGILSETIKIIKQRVFDGDSTPSESATKKAWGLIERLVVTNPDSTNTAEAINQLTRETMQEVSVAEDATEGERQAFEAIKQTVGATKLNNELFKYAIKLAGQGDNSMLNYLLNNELNVVGTSVKSRGDVGRTLGALEGLKSYIVQANEAEQAGFIQLAAQRFFNTTTPTEDQIAKIKRILTAVNETKVNEEEAILEELTQVGEKIGTELVENINTQIDKASKPEVKDPMVAAITAMLKLGGTFVYRKTKNKIKAAVEKTIKGGITNYRDKLVEGAASGLETGFWKTLASEQKRIGPLGELDTAQNRELGNIVKNTLVGMKLQGKLGKPLAPDEKKMDIYEQVASILGEKPLSQDKIKSADEKIRTEINRKRENELQETEDQDVQDAINLKYDRIEFAWDEAMSRNLDMAVSDTMLRRLIFNELKEGKTSVAKLATLMNEEPTIGASRQDRIVSSIINKIAGVTFEGQNPADYTTLKEYLSNQLESLIQEKQTEKKVVKTKERVKANQAQTELDKLARIQSDTPNFPTSEKVANPVRDAVRNALKLVLNPMFDPKASADIMRNWKKSFAAELQQLGVDETTALTLTDVVGRQIELDSISKNLDAIDNAINKGALSGVINAIKNTPLADQQKPDWRYEVMRDYLRNAGLPMAQAEKIAKLMDISLKKRFAKAQEEAAASIAKTILKGIKPESNRGFTALIQAIRAQVLNPGSNVAKEFGRAMGWKGFTAEQLKALNEFDSKINDETITEAERAVALEGIKKIIDKVALPTRVRDSLSAFYIGQALGRLPVATVQVVDPAIFSGLDAAVVGLKNITSPELAMQIWGNYISSLINAGREFAFSFKNDVTRSGRLVDYLETQDRKLKRLRNDADNLWRNGQYKQAIKKYLFSYPEITSRVLKALDDASFSLLQQNALNQYMISAMNMAKIPKKDQLGTLRMIAQARQMDIADMRANGISKNDAIIYANERMKATISNALSGLNLNSSEIIDAAINDSLSRIGKTRFKEQFSGDAELKDEGSLSYPFLKIYEGTSQFVSGIKGKRGEAMRVFQRMIFGFPLIVARVANVAYGYTPLSIYRHAMQKKFGNYPLTYGTAIQRRKRWVEQLTGLAVLAPLFFLRSMSFDDDDEKPIRIVFTGFGPVRSKDPEAYNQWHKKHNPGSLEIFIGDKRYAIDSKSAGPLKPMIEILGAIDDWQIKTFQENAKLTKEEKKKVEENAGLLGTLGGIAGSFALTAARRGPATGLMQGLIDFRRYPDDPLAAIAQEASFSLTPFLPIVGFGATKNVSDFLSEPIDTRTKEGAILNNLPIIGPMFGKPAINAFGQPIGDVEISEKIRKSIGIPITLVPVSSGDDAKLAKITLKNANGPEPLQRNWFDAKFETPLSDQEWRTVNEDYARSNRKTVLENYEELNGFDPEIYKTAISNVGTASKYSALDNLYKARKKP